MLKRLQAHGLITRSRSATDERTMQVELTTEGPQPAPPGAEGSARGGRAARRRSANSSTLRRPRRHQRRRTGRRLRRRAGPMATRPLATRRRDRSLRESIRDRIRNGLTGSAATPAHFIHSMTALLPVYAGVALLLPGSPAYRAAALVLAVVLALVDSFAFLAANTCRRPAQRYRRRGSAARAAW